MFGFKKKIAVDPTMSPKRTVRIRYNHGTIPAVQAVSLQKKVDAAAVSLTKKSLFGFRMAVVALVDASGSMGRMYADGVVQELTERSLGFTLALDDDGVIPVGTFGSTFEHKADVTKDNYRGIVDRERFYTGGSTNLSDALANLEAAVDSVDEPIYCLIVTDGAPDSRSDVVKRIARLSQYPIFFKFLVVGNDRSAQKFVQDEIDDMTTGRLIDNADAQMISNPSALTDQEFADMMVEELDGWIAEAKRVGLLVD